MPRMPGQENPDIRFEVHIQATLPHSTVIDAIELNAELANIESVFRDYGGDVTISFVRTTKGAGDTKSEAGASDRPGSYM